MIPEVEKLYAWLSHVSHTANAKKRDLQWKTPSGFNVLLCNRKPIKWPNMVDVIFADGTRFKRDGQRPGDELDERAQTRGLAPNFIHSLDAALLARTIYAAGKQISDWACAHDAIAVPAWQWHTVLNLVRLEHAAMYTPDLLGAQSDSWRRKLPGLRDPPGQRTTLPVAGIDVSNPYSWL
jgi:DNA-directed RNA polymerase